MAKITLTDIATFGPSAITAINNNNAAIETAMENTLSRDGTSPNMMNADLDMNSNALLNMTDLDMNDHRILGLPEAVLDVEPVRRGDLLDLITANSTLSDADRVSAHVFEFTGDGATTTFDLADQIIDLAAISGESLILWYEDGIQQRYGTDFTISGTVVTRTTAPADGAVIYGWLIDVFSSNVSEEVAIVSELTDGATVSLDASLGSVFTLAAEGDRTILAPTNVTNGQKIIIRHTATGGARTLTLTTGSSGAFRYGTDITGLTQTDSGLTDYIGCIYNGTAVRWDVVAYTKGF